MKVICALFTSILIHGLVAAALIVYLEYAPHPDVLATLDLSSVELSFAEKEVEEAAAVAALPVAAERRPPKPKVDEPPPETKLEKPLSPEVGEIKFPEPKEDVRPKMEYMKAVSAPPVAPRQAKLDVPPKPKRNIRPVGIARRLLPESAFAEVGRHVHYPAHIKHRTVRD